MEWNWLYLIPLGFAAISAVAWLIIFFINYSNSKSISQATTAATEAVNNLKGVIGMVKIRNADGTYTVLNGNTTVEVETVAEETVAEETVTEETVAEETVAEETVTATVSVLSATVSEEATSKADDTEDFIKFLRKLYNAFKG